MLNCHSLTAKCRMRKLLVDLKEHRAKTKNLGTLGPCQFEDMDVFLKNAKGSMPFFYNHKDVLSFGDVHGDLLATLGALYLGNVIDDHGNWCGKNILVVQLGDVLDRSGRGNDIDTSQNPREEIDILQYFHALNMQAMQYGGAVVSLSGNHETGQFTQSPLTKETKYEGGALHLAGWQGLNKKRQLFQPKTALAIYFAKFKPLIVQNRNFLFLHGGITPGNGLTVQNINQTWQQFLIGKIPNLPQPIVDVVWSRTLSDNQITEQDCVTTTNQIFQEFKLGSNGGLVLGHSIQADGIPYFCSGKVWKLDIGLSETFNKPMLEVLRIHFSDKGDVFVKIVSAIKNSFIQIRSFQNGKPLYVEEVKRYTI